MHLKILPTVLVTNLVAMFYSSMLLAVSVTTYGVYSESGDVKFNNVVSVTITGHVRAEQKKIDINNVGTLSVTGDMFAEDSFKTNNTGSGLITGNVESEKSVSIDSNVSVTGTSGVVGSIGALTLTEIPAPTGTTDANNKLPITIITGDYTITGSVALNGTIYATGQIHIDNGSSISGTGALVAGGQIHVNNVTSVGGVGSEIFIYSLNDNIHFNNVSSVELTGTVYAPNGGLHFNNVDTATILGGVFTEDTIDFNNITAITIGPGSYSTNSIPPGIQPVSGISLCHNPGDPTLAYTVSWGDANYSTHQAHSDATGACLVSNPCETEATLTSCITTGLVH